MNFRVFFNALMVVCLSLTLPACRQDLSIMSQPGSKPREALINALKARMAAKSYSLKVSQTSTHLTHTQEGHYIAPDRYHMTAQTISGGRDSGQHEMIMIGKDAYIKSDDGKWRKSQIENAKQLELSRRGDQMLIESLSKAKDEDVKFLGQEDLDGSQTFIYQYSFAGTPEIPGRSQTKTWVGKSDRLPHKVEIDSEMTYLGKPMSVKTTATYSDYNAEFKIEAPI